MATARPVDETQEMEEADIAASLAAVRAESGIFHESNEAFLASLRERMKP